MTKSHLPLLTFVIGLILCSPAIAQDKIMSFTIEYSPNISKTTNEFTTDVKFSHSAFARMTLNLRNKISPSIGFGYLNTGDVINHVGFSPGSKNYFNFNYFTIPVGVKINLGKLYVLPEFGFAIHLSSMTKIVTPTGSGATDISKYDMEMDDVSFNDPTYPIFLSIGKDFNIGNMSFLAGIKGYYSLNTITSDTPQQSHYYGIGAVLGINL